VVVNRAAHEAAGVVISLYCSGYQWPLALYRILLSTPGMNTL